MQRYCGWEIDCIYVNGCLVWGLSRIVETAVFWGEDPEGLLHMTMLILINMPTPMSINLSIRPVSLRVKTIV